jgi:ATP-dependent DNA helicase RecQ
LRTLLKDTFGLPGLRDAQASVIEQLMAGTPTLAVMPTGAGKSLCYQLPALLMPGRAVIVSPLIALMKDQCDKLEALGVPAVQLHSSLLAEEVSRAEQGMADGSAKLIFVTPERLAEPAFLASLQSHPVSLLVIDEAHCISQWGHDFRPAFLEIGAALPKLSAQGKPTVLALTATATQDVIQDIVTQLGVPGMKVINTGIFRPNLHFQVRQLTNESDKLAAVIEWAARQKGSGIVYAATVKAVEQVHAALREAGESVARYHGRLAARERRENQNRFMQGDDRIMVATNAFGLGIDKLDTRFVLHYQLPGGLDAYYQEAGRAGRDGAVADCMLLHYHRDKAVQQFFLIGKYPDAEDVGAVYAALLGPAPDGQPWTVKRLKAHVQRPEGKVQVALKLLRDHGVVAQDRKGVLRVRKTDLNPAAIERLVATFEERRENDRAQLERMVFYAQTGFCRWRVLLEHYDEEQQATEPCGTCDNCQRMAAIANAPEMDKASEASEPTPLARSPAPAFATGQKVKVPRYGVGEVKEADSETVTLIFPNGKSRSFLASYARPCA